MQHCISDRGSSLALLYLGISSQSFNLSLSALFMGLYSFDMLNIAKCKRISFSKPDTTFSYQNLHFRQSANILTVTNILNLNHGIIV